MSEAVINGWETVWSSPGERLLVQARDEGSWIRHRTISNQPGDGAVVLLRRSDGRVLFIRVPRPALGKSLLELPRGQAEESDGTPVRTAARELLEETGREVTQPRVLGQVFSDSGLSGDATFVVLGEDGGRPAGGADPEYEEQLWLGATEIRVAIADAHIADGITLGALAQLWAMST